MAELEKLARVYIWSAAVARVLLAAAPLAAVIGFALFALGGFSISVEGN